MSVPTAAESFANADVKDIFWILMTEFLEWFHPSQDNEGLIDALRDIQNVVYNLEVEKNASGLVYFLTDPETNLKLWDGSYTSKFNSRFYHLVSIDFGGDENISESKAAVICARLHRKISILLDEKLREPRTLPRRRYGP